MLDRRWSTDEIDLAAARLEKADEACESLRSEIKQQIMQHGFRQKCIRGRLFEIFLSTAGVVKVFPYENET